MGTHHQPYFLEKAKEDLVHHSAAWVVKKPERSPSSWTAMPSRTSPRPGLESSGNGLEPR